ncbi:MAG: ABC transporter ATP-binding protein [Chloroflexota bacterium]|nr:ABC transporter ATP-binding protein [Chloroflexia bacterium]MDQ3226939.1 ABC transporter ATP-binding protein [Chloroflexota bacterium]
MSETALLRIEDLRISFSTRTADVRAVDGVDLDIRAGEVLGLVGESGSGKSVTARSVMRLVPMPPGKLVSGRILFHGDDLASLPERDMEDLRGSKISMIFQDPMTFLNPLYTAGEQVSEAIRRHQALDRSGARDETIRLFQEVGIPSPELRYYAYPHQLSGGLRQRVMIAMALSSRPELLIADEPTTALDVTIQAQILALLGDLQQEYGMSILLITHDLGVVAEMCDRVAVMYAGRIVERAPIDALFDDPEHPYSLGLMNAIPRPDLPDLAPQPIDGLPPDMAHPPSGCPFHPRCPYCEPICSEVVPVMRAVAPGHETACHFAGVKPFKALAPIMATTARR